MEREFYKNGYELTLKNSKILSSSSEMIALSGNYGLACSLNILAAEEALKSIYIMLKHFNPDYQIADFENVFKDHRHKHKKLKDIIKIYEIELKKNRDFFEPYKPIFEISEDKKSILSEVNRKQFENLKVLYERSRMYNLKDYTEILTWLEKANDDKNNGLYVGINNNEWRSPSSFTEEKFVRERKYTTEILEIVDYFETLHIDLLKVRF